MNLKNNTADKVAKSVLDDILIEFENIKKAYLESNDFKALVAIKVKEIDELLDKANEMSDAVNSIPKNTYISFGKYHFTYNEDLDVFEFNGLEETAKSEVISDLKLNDGWCIRNDKRKYIQHKVKAIVSTLDESITAAEALKVVRSQINLEEILHNKDI